MKALRPFLATVLATLVLVSSTSFMVGMHFCMGEVQSVALFTKAAACEKEQMLPPCHRHVKAPCCDDENVVHQGEAFKGSVEHVNIAVPSSVDIEQPSVLLAEVIPAAPLSRIYYYNYDPPLRSSDLTVELRVFLI